MIIVLTGSQLWNDPKVIWEVLEELLSACEEKGDVLIVYHGKCYRGADKIADDWIREQSNTHNRPVLARAVPAMWEMCGGQCRPNHRKVNKSGVEYCPTAGYRSNWRMIEDSWQAGARLCVAFILDGSPGSTRCANHAKRRGMKTIPYRQGSVDLRQQNSR